MAEIQKKVKPKLSVSNFKRY